MREGPLDIHCSCLGRIQDDMLDRAFRHKFEQRDDMLYPRRFLSYAFSFSPV